MRPTNNLPDYVCPRDAYDDHLDSDVDNDVEFPHHNDTVFGHVYYVDYLVLRAVVDDVGRLVAMVNYVHCGANVKNVASRLDDDDGKVNDLGTPPTVLAECALQIGPFCKLALVFISR